VSMEKLQRCVVAFPISIVARLDKLAEMASNALRCDVPRAAVLRAITETWLDATEDGDPAPIVESIQAAMLKRGRKRRPREPLA
jgi:hypothetical protein